jgi:hypothetical protein
MQAQSRWRDLLKRRQRRVALERLRERHGARLADLVDVQAAARQQSGSGIDVSTEQGARDLPERRQQAQFIRKHVTIPPAFQLLKHNCFGLHRPLTLRAERAVTFHTRQAAPGPASPPVPGAESLT